MVREMCDHHFAFISLNTAKMSQMVFSISWQDLSITQAFNLFLFNLKNKFNILLTIYVQLSPPPER